MLDLKSYVQSVGREGTRNTNDEDENDDFPAGPGGSNSVRRLSNTVKNLSNMQKKIVGGLNEVRTRFNKQQEFLKEGFNRIGELENSCCSANDNERYSVSITD